jgi:MFS family permease
MAALWGKSVSSAAPDLHAGGAPASERVPPRSWYALGLLFLVYVCNFIDRSILGILNQPIKEDLGLTDTHMGFLGGVAFAIFYTFVGIPVARLADTSVRRNVIAVSLALWSGMTMVCGLVVNFWQLLVARSARPAAARLRTR